MKKNIFIFGAIALLFGLTGLFFGIKKLEPQTPENTAVANLLNQSMIDTSGTSQPLSQWKDKALIVNFWATWCAPCVDEMPELSALHGELVSRNIQILGVGIDSLDNIVAFRNKHNIQYPLYAAGMTASDLSRHLGNQVGGLPFTVLVDHQGQVRKTYLGRLKMQELRQDLASL
jgi:peroxiredoxin